MLLYDKVLSVIAEQNLLGESPLNLLAENQPDPNDSLAELINKLSCCTTQMWYNQDILYKMRFMSRDEFLKEYNGKLEEVHMCLKRACDLNVQRANVMDAIDKKLLDIKMNEIK